VDVVVTDVEMPGMSGIDLCAILRERHPELLSMVVTGHHDFDTAIAAIRAGAYDFISKPVKLEAVEIAVSRAVEYLAVAHGGRSSPIHDDSNAGSHVRAHVSARARPDPCPGRGSASNPRAARGTFVAQLDSEKEEGSICGRRYSGVR
jgi:DNA-binding NtrC family response regulator